jgi:hypothetical protein
MSTFSVVEFLGEESVEAVPSMWIEKLSDVSGEKLSQIV